MNVAPASTSLAARLERHDAEKIMEDHSVATSDESAEQKPRIRTPGRHVVTITGWDYREQGAAQDVVFEVEDTAGRQQEVRFGLSKLELASGALNRFLSTVLQRQLPEPEGIQPRFFHQMLFNQTVGRRVLLVVIKTSRGVQIVMDWESVPQPPAPARSGANDD